jgi:hypothetical protein
MPCEYVGDATAPTGYTLDGSLVIDDSAKIGCAIDPKTHVARAFDLELKLIATDTISALFQRPTKTTVLTADISASATTFEVASTRGWGDSDLHIGTSLEEYGGALLDEFVSVTRGTYGRQRSYRKGTLIADKPYVWRGRRVTLYMAMLDPSGRYVQGASILETACVVWSGYIDERPFREGSHWIVPCRDEVRRLSEPLGVAASGAARWSTADDELLAIDTGAVLTLNITDDDGGTGYTDEEYTLRPFSGLTSPAYKSQLRAAIVEAIDAARAVTGASWAEEATDDIGMRRQYRLVIPVDFGAGNIQVWIRCAIDGAGNIPFIFANEPSAIFAISTGAATRAIPIGLTMRSRVNGAALSVELDDIAPGDLPTSGFVQLEREGNTSYFQYDDLEIDAQNPQLVRLIGAPGSALASVDLEAVARGELEDPEDVSAKFFWLDTGKLADILRRAIVSTGDAQNGSFDTLPKGQGLGIPDISSLSFPAIFDGLLNDLTFTVASEAGTSFEKLFGGILRLSARALTARRSSGGSALEIAAIRVGSADSPPVATITESLLVSSSGRRPIRVTEVYAAPQAIEVTCRTLPIGDTAEGEGKIIATDKHLVDRTSVRWSLDVYGVDRATLKSAVEVWSLAWFRAAENRQVLEIDVPPWVDAQPGDVVKLELTDPHLWDYALASPGLSGLARVLGAQWSLVSGVQTITVSVDGILAAGAMSPSIPIEAVNGSPVTSFDVNDSYLDLLTYARDGQSSWYLLAYQPGHDGGTARYTVSTVTDIGGGQVRIGVTGVPSSPTAAPTSSWRLTWPIADDCTDTQDPYLHNTDKVQWG